MELNSNFWGAFTLIELLVVITVIAILMALLFPAFKGVQDQAKRTQAKNDLTQIVTAVNAYYTDYGKYPLAAIDGSADTVFGTSLTNENLFDVLRATGLGRDTVDPTDTTGNKNLNLRRIVFISPPDVKDPVSHRSGMGTAPGTVGQYYDPWGQAYRIALDGSYDNKITPNPYTSNAGSNPLSSGAIAWSLGKDGLGGTGDKNAGTNDDDVISWQ
jgi:prepilin-type N-terminal cleavage/methylation domain-containing protein